MMVDEIRDLEYFSVKGDNKFYYPLKKIQSSGTP